MIGLFEGLLVGVAVDDWIVTVFDLGDLGIVSYSMTIVFFHSFEEPSIRSTNRKVNKAAIAVRSLW